MATNESTTITISDIIYQSLNERERSLQGTTVKKLLIMRTAEELEVE